MELYANVYHKRKHAHRKGTIKKAKVSCAKAESKSIESPSIESQPIESQPIESPSSESKTAKKPPRKTSDTKQLRSALRKKADDAAEKSLAWCRQVLHTYRELWVDESAAVSNQDDFLPKEYRTTVPPR